MEVSQIANLDTHAVIGGGDAEAFGIDDNPEFYTMLSDTMYRDKYRAVVRETICNAWDAHIASLRTDMPVEITLTDAEMIIRDFGYGIAPHMMKPIYCVYGRSTKKKDVNQTGGFGLGSKAPFAYGDHFTVESSFEGSATIYALSRGGLETDGKPDLRPMVTIPSNQSGVTVTIPLRKKEDRASFERIIKSVVMQGGMYATLNGVELYRWDYTKARELGFCTAPLFELRESNVYLLYGTVLYPVSTEDPEISDLVDDVYKLVSLNARLILVAAPNTVGVTPSRESLSYSEMTQETIKDLLKRAKRRITARLQPARKAYAKYGVRDIKQENLQFGINDHELHAGGFCDTVQLIAEQTVSNRRGMYFEGKERKKLLLLAAAKKLKSSAIRRAAYAERVYEDQLSHRWTMRLPLRLAAKFDLLKGMMGFRMRAYAYHESGKKMLPIAEFSHANRLIKPKILIARNQRDLQELFSNTTRGFRRYDLKMEDILVGFVVKQWSAALMEKVRAEAARLKLEVVAYNYEVPRAKPKPKRDQTKYVAVDTFLHDDYSDQAELTEPKYFLMSYMRGDKVHAPVEHRRAGAVSMGQKYPGTAVITNAPQREKLIKEGAQDLALLLAKRLTELLKRRDVVYGLAVEMEKMAGYTYHGEPGHIANKIAAVSFELAKLIFPDRSNPGADYYEALEIRNFLKSLLTSYHPDETRKAVFNALELIETRIHALFPKIAKPQADKQFAYLRVLRGSAIVDNNYQGTRRDMIDDTADAIRTLQRRYKARAAAPRNQSQPMKEAA